MSGTKNHNAYAILPYLRTTQPVHICGLTFRSTRDVEILDEEERQQLEQLSSLFFLRNHLQIKEMVYVHYTTNGPTLPEWFERRLKIAQMYLGFLYSGSTYDGATFYCIEHMSVFEFTPATVFKHNLLFSEEKLTNDLWPEPRPFSSGNLSRTPGFKARLNSFVTFPIVQGGRIYPASPNIWLNSNQDIHTNLVSFESQPVNWALTRFFADPDAKAIDFTERILNSLEWHNRSTSLNIDEGTALLYLAIALESLLSLENGEKITDRFKETLRTLIGPVPRLDSWCYQFYEARSKIVHQGSSPYLNFYAASREDVSKLRKGTDSNIVHRSLTAYGRKIFQIALITIVSGAVLAQDAKLSSAFVTNNERLINIQKILNGKDTPPGQRLKEIAQSVMELETFFLEEKVIDNEAFTSAIKSFVRTYLETNPKVSSEVEEALQAVVGGTTKLNFGTEMDSVRWLAQCVNQWTNGVIMMESHSERTRLIRLQENPIHTLDLFVQMAYSM